MIEKWKVIPGFENYQVSNTGKVRNISHTIPKLLKLSNNGNGYLRVFLYSKANKKPTKFFIHRLVAAAFLKNPKQLKYVHHIDHIKTKNTSEDLMWVTASENNRYKNEFYSKLKQNNKE